MTPSKLRAPEADNAPSSLVQQPLELPALISLPQDVLTHLFQFLPETDQLSLARTGKRFQRAYVSCLMATAADESLQERFGLEPAQLQDPAIRRRLAEDIQSVFQSSFPLGPEQLTRQGAIWSSDTLEKLTMLEADSTVRMSLALANVRLREPITTMLGEAASFAESWFERLGTPPIECADFTGWYLSVLTHHIGQLKYLKSLALGYRTQPFAPTAPSGSLFLVSAEIGQLVHLEGLSILGTLVSTLPQSLWSLTNLRKLKLENNEFSVLPPEIGQLVQLRKLLLDHNHLTELPPEIGSLSQLTRLGLGHNQLTSLPETIGRLTALKRLVADSNRLSSLPPTIGLLTALQELSLSDNQLTSVPPVLKDLPELELLDLTKNPFTEVPEDLLELLRGGTCLLPDQPFRR